MDILQTLNNAVTYIEAHLCDEINIDELAQIALYTPDGFNRFFSYITGMTLGEYVRRRRLTLAAYELRVSSVKVIDIAVKYGYDSADAFAKAFFRQHGIMPTAARASDSVLKVYPHVSFHIKIKGAKEMDFKIIETQAIKLRGISKQFTGAAGERFEQEHIMWADHHDDVQSKVSTAVSGKWYGIWDCGQYWIAKAADVVRADNTDLYEIPAGTYAVFTTGFGGFAGDELPKLRELIFDSWLPDSGYAHKRDYEIEVYHLYPKAEKSKRHYEIWIAVEKKIS